MALKTLVKVGNISNLSDARYCAGMGVDMLGFNLDAEDPEAISMEDYTEIAEWLSGVRFIGEFSRAEISEIASVYCELNLDAVEVIDPDLPADLSLRGIPAILKIALEDSEDNMKAMMDYCSDSVEYFILEVKGTLTDAMESMLRKLAGDFPVLLGGDLPEKKILELAEKLPLKGIALKGSREEKPGFKDYDALADILEKLEIDDME